jgi:threonine/homoserine/homoserine lactone efflux protein
VKIQKARPPLRQAETNKLDSFLTFVIAITILTIAPGADTLLVIRNALRGGLRDGTATTIAICSGLFIHATISAVGISLIILQSAWIFTALKLLGALYLIYLGVTTIRSRQNVAAIDGVMSDDFILLRSLREGLLSNVLNPKPIVFYMAFLPQFIDPQGSALLQSFSLAGVHFVISVIWLVAVAMMAAQMRHWLNNETVARRINQTLGVGLFGFGVALASDMYRTS